MKASILSLGVRAWGERRAVFLAEKGKRVGVGVGVMYHIATLA
jgi:hypothetical protein